MPKKKFTIDATISFACSTYGATLRYTTNGAEPSATSGELYTAALKLVNAMSFKVKGIKDGLALSDTLSVTINKVATPVFVFSKEAETVAITCSTADAIIKYTTDGSIPSETHGTTYVGAIPVTDTTTFQIKAFKAGWIDSEQVAGKAVLAQIILPVFPHADEYIFTLIFVPLGKTLKQTGEAG